MLDPIALLQSLTLPAGATTGRRIELDGVNGVIRVFDTTGAKRIQISDPTDATRSGRILLFGAPTTVGDQLNGGDIFAGVLNDGAANERLFLDLDAPVPNWGTLFPTILMTTQAKDLSIPSTIELDADLIRFTGITAFAQLIFDNGPNLYRGASATQLKTDGSLNAVNDLLVNAVSLPRGIVAAPAVSSAVTTGITTVETKDGGCGDYTFTAVAGRRYRIKYQARARSTVVGDKVDIRIRDGGAASPTNASTLVAGAETSSGSTTGDDLKVDSAITLSAGTHTIAAFYVRAAGTGTVTLDQATGQQRELYVEDIGAI